MRSRKTRTELSAALVVADTLRVDPEHRGTTRLALALGGTVPPGPEGEVAAEAGVAANTAGEEAASGNSGRAA